MAVVIELHNLGDYRLCRDITARIEHAFSDRRGGWRVTLTASRASESCELKVEGPNGFERSLNWTRIAGEDEADTIYELILQLLPSS